jgi:hypothetical protein
LENVKQHKSRIQVDEKLSMQISFTQTNASKKRREGEKLQQQIILQKKLAFEVNFIILNNIPAVSKKSRRVTSVKKDKLVGYRHKV